VAPPLQIGGRPAQRLGHFNWNARTTTAGTEAGRYNGCAQTSTATRGLEFSPIGDYDISAILNMRLKTAFFDTGRDGFWRNLGLLITRVGFTGTLLLRHGLPKIPALITGPIQFFDPLGLGPGVSLGLAIFAEVVCSVALLLGFLSRFASATLAINFAIVVFFIHQAEIPGDRGELALLYLLVFSALTLTGPGRFSFDARLRRER